jgi:glycyl-tRNA synthetase beta chain
MPAKETEERIKQYLLDRLRGFTWPKRDADKGASETVAGDIIEAVLASEPDDLTNAMDRMVSLQRMSRSPELAQAAKIIERTRNILRSSRPSQGQVDPARLMEPQEKQLWDVYQAQQSRIRGLAESRSYEEATTAFGDAFSAPLHAFFASVMVNVPDEELKQNRLALMQSIQALYTDRIADLSKLTGLQP